MKFYSMNGSTEPEVEHLLVNSYWNSAQTTAHDAYLLEGHKLLLDAELEPLTNDTNQKDSLDMLDNILHNSSSLNALSDLKPLPPFTGYTGHLSINGISGHHYHAIAQRLPEENNNNYMASAYQTSSLASTTSILGATSIQLTTISPPLSSTNNDNISASLTLTNDTLENNNGSSHDQNLVSSSTCLNENVLNASADAQIDDVKLFPNNQLDNKLYPLTDNCLMTNRCHNNGTTAVAATTGFVCQSSEPGSVRIFTDAKDLTEYVDMNSIDDIAAIIGNAIADTTVPNSGDKEDATDTRDSWMDLDAWIDGNYIQHDGKLVLQQQDSLSDFILPQSPAYSNSSALHNLLSQGYMPLLQNRLQNGPPTPNIKKETPSSTSYCSNELRTSTSASTSPPNSVVSTTDNFIMNAGYINNTQQYRISSLKSEGICSPDILNNFPHTTTGTSAGILKSKRSRSQKKNSNTITQNQSSHIHKELPIIKNPSSSSHQFNSIASPTSVSYSTNDLSGLLSKEKPIHRCNICNRGFLNKSNIKVHLRTHTGEKPFRCEVCSKAFRQKAHLLKHQQIHKRIGRD